MTQSTAGVEATFPPQATPRNGSGAATVTPLPTRTLTGAREHLLRTRAKTSEREARSTEAQHGKGKLSALERITLLTDKGSFREIEGFRLSVGGDDASRGDGVVTGFGDIHGAPVAIFAQDFTVRGGSFGQAHADKILRLLQAAERLRCPVVGLYDGGGARIHEGAMALNGCGEMFQQIVRLSGVVPQISVVLGPCAGAAAYAPALTDAVFMVRGTSMMYLTGPDVVEKVTGERTDGQALGGAGVHGHESGVAAFVHDSEEDCLGDVRYLVSLLPSSITSAPERLDTGDSIDRPIPQVMDLVPADPKVPYDMVALIEALVDSDTFLEFHADWATNVVVGFARLDGWSVGVVANQPSVRAGVLDSPASEKAARFVSLCDAFQIPILTLVDVPGFMPGSAIERGGVIRHGAKLLHAYCAATVPRIQVIIRKAYGGAYIVMDSPSTGNDLSYAWPTNEVAVMGAEAAVEIIHRRRLTQAEDPDALRDQLGAEYRATQMHPYVAADSGLVHDVIDPLDTRRRVAESLTLLATKQVAGPARKHANPPF